MRRRRPNFAGIFFVTLAVVVGSFAFADTRRYPNLPTRIEIEATLIPSFDNRDPSQTRFGDLEFRGGIALTSKNPAFGGVSALHVEPDGSHFIAVTDHGSWLRGRIVYRDGKPVGITGPKSRRSLAPTASRSARAAGMMPSPSPNATARFTLASSG